MSNGFKSWDELHNPAFFQICLLLCQSQWSSASSTVSLNMTGRKKEFEYIACQFEMVSWKFLKKIPSIFSAFWKSLKLKRNPFPNPVHLAMLCMLAVLVSSLITTCLWYQLLSSPNSSHSAGTLKWHLVFIASGVPSLRFCEAEQKIEKQLWFKTLN